ncbi:sigma-54-dependent transcriptional regulator [Candidatus Entotheonella palauensis]|uniref:sigma-54-dependent transcriptional regulator n=1 Tax=Candidatus Entotheonella palauensis TaxID=93172 RepID=UPI0004BB73DA|nr:sigma-54 dependent transcriptional regulator [Candidatus Entotheonella palauensis]
MSHETLPVKGNILIVDDTPDNLRLLSAMLTKRGYKVRSVINGKMALDATRAMPPDLILLDIRMPDMDGYEVCQRLKADVTTNAIPVIFLSALDDMLDKVKAFSIGGVDYISKPFEVNEVLVRVDNHLAIRAAQEEVRQLNIELENRVRQRTQQLSEAVSRLEREVSRRQEAEAQLLRYQSELEQRVEERTTALRVSEQRFAQTERELEQLVQERQYLQEELRTACNFDDIVGSCEALTAVLSTVARVAPTEATVMIQGESGTGKELIARALHTNSARRDRPFIKVNCGAFPSSLVESELFGHEKGAFTGAHERRVGRFELAHGGTLFLDEIGEMPLEVQVKLLRVIQEREFERVGGRDTLAVDVRLIAATHRDLKQEVEAGRFREDLYYRIHVFPIELPPLRARREDIPLLVQHFVAKHSAKLNILVTTIPTPAMQALCRYDWPGNIRELENVIERAMILTSGPVLELAPNTLAFTSESELPVLPAASSAQTLEEVERHYLQTVLEQCQWVINGPNGAAEIVGLHPNTLRHRLQKLGLSRPE